MNGRRYVILLLAMNSIKKKNIQQLSKDCDMTPSHLTIVMKQWEKEGLINKIKSGREFVIELTEVGKQVLEVIKIYAKLLLVYRSCKY
jgi:DNA-binding MarR family transcriptional regulator